MEKSLLIFFIVIVVVSTLIIIFLNQTKSNTFQPESERCPHCSIEERIGLIPVCRCAYNTTLKTDLYGHGYCAIKKTRCKSGWQTCTESCPDKLGYCEGECLYDG